MNIVEAKVVEDHIVFQLAIQT